MTLSTYHVPNQVVKVYISEDEALYTEISEHLRLLKTPLSIGYLAEWKTVNNELKRVWQEAVTSATISQKHSAAAHSKAEEEFPHQSHKDRLCFTAQKATHCCSTPTFKAVIQFLPHMYKEYRKCHAATWRSGGTATGFNVSFRWRSASASSSKPLSPWETASSTH